MDNRTLVKLRKYATITIVVIIFFTTLVLNIPAWVLSSQVAKYSNNRLTLYNLSGSFWDGSGLLVASSKNGMEGAPIAHLKWKITPGLTRFINIQFSMDQHKVATVYIDKHGLNIDNLDLSLSIVQVSHISDVVKDLNISGNFQINANHILIAQKPSGRINIKVRNMSSGLSPVNPLGSYNINYNMETSKIEVSTENNAALTINGSGSTSGLILKASVNPDKVEKMRTFITLLGMPNADGTYNIKLF